jgi:hypothetical protein
MHTDPEGDLVSLAHIAQCPTEVFSRKLWVEEVKI